MKLNFRGKAEAAFGGTLYGGNPPLHANDGTLTGCGWHEHHGCPTFSKPVKVQSIGVRGARYKVPRSCMAFRMRNQFLLSLFWICIGPR